MIANQRLSPPQRGLLAGSIARGASDARFIVAQKARWRDPARQSLRTPEMSGQMIEAQGPRAYREQGAGTESESAHADIVIDLNLVRQRYSALQHLLQAASIYYAVKVSRPRNFLGRS